MHRRRRRSRRTGAFMPASRRWSWRSSCRCAPSSCPCSGFPPRSRAAGGRVARGRPGSALHPCGRVAGQGHVPLFRPPGHDRAAPRVSINPHRRRATTRASSSFCSAGFRPISTRTHRRSCRVAMRASTFSPPWIRVRRQRLSHGRGILGEGQAHLRLRRQDLKSAPDRFHREIAAVTRTYCRFACAGQNERRRDRAMRRARNIRCRRWPACPTARKWRSAGPCIGPPSFRPALRPGR